MRTLFLFLLLVCLPVSAEYPRARYFRTMDIRNGLSQNTVYQILQDKKGFLWFGTKDGLNRYDGISFRVYRKENSALGRNFINALYEDGGGRIWVGTEGGVYIYDPVADSFAAFNQKSDKGTAITDFVTMITADKQGNIWISAENDGIFCYNPKDDKLFQRFHNKRMANVTHFWLRGNSCYVALYNDNLYTTSTRFNTSLRPFRDADGKEIFKNDVINWQVSGPHNCTYVASRNGLTEINLTTGRTRKLLQTYVRTLRFRQGDELWAGTETGLYIINVSSGKTTHLTVPDQDDAYSLADNAIYSICCDAENGMWIGSYFGGVNYCPYQWTYFEKFYPHDDMQYFGRRVREICEGDDGTLWIGTEDKGLFNFNPKSGAITPFDNPTVYKNVHGLCRDGADLWVGTFSGGLNRINLRTHAVKHYAKGEGPRSLPANDVFTICKTSGGDLFMGTTSGTVRYNRKTDDFTPIKQLGSLFTYHIHEDADGNLWFATFSNGVFRLRASDLSWKNYRTIAGDTTSLPYNKVISIFEDSSRRLWLMTLGEGFCRYNADADNFTRYGLAQGLPSNTVYKMVEAGHGNLWLSTNAGLVCFNPDTQAMRTYTTANGLLSNQFNFQSGYASADGRIYMGSINGFVAFNPEHFKANTCQPPVVITDFYLFNKRQTAPDRESPLRQSITYSDGITLAANQNTFSFQVAVLSYQAPEMNRLEYRMDGFDHEWHAVGDGALINYSNMPYGDYKLRLRGANSDGQWCSVERVLKVTIRPPFYLSIWAKLLYVLLFVGGAFAVYFYIRRRIHERHRQEMDLFEHEKERELYTAKIDFFTNVAHEIRTPLTLIKSPLENVLASPDVTTGLRDDLETMEMNTNRLLDLVNQLLDFRKTETHGFSLNFVERDVAVLIQTTVKRFRPLMRERLLALTIDAPDHLNASVDSEGLVKIVSNLLTNATKYAASYIRISLTADEQRLQLTVTNDGIIVPQPQREEIFKPFVQYKSGEARPVAGTGIGLALARSLAELHEGTLCMGPATDCNSFVLTLPLHHEQTIVSKHPMEESAENATDAGETAVLPHRYTLLIVEDSIDMQRFVAKQFSADYNLLTACNGVEALDVLRKNAVNLIVTDIMMPDMDGMELCEKLKSDLETSHIPIILLTAKTTLQAKIEGMRLGADAYIEKPFSVEYLKACVANLLKGREKLRAAFAHSPFVETGTVAMTKADEAFLKTLRELVMAHMQDSDFGLDQMAAALNMSRSSLNRKIKGVLDLTPNDYIRLERLKRAAELLKEGNSRINEVCYMTGFNTPSYFTKCFQKQFGVLPKDFK